MLEKVGMASLNPTVIECSLIVKHKSLVSLSCSLPELYSVYFSSLYWKVFHILAHLATRCLLFVEKFCNFFMSDIGKKICVLCIVLLDCFILNCLSQKPVEEVNPDHEQLLFCMLFKHLEDIPLQNPQHMV